MKDATPSTTAARVSAYRLTFPRVPAPYGDPAADERLARDVAGSPAPDPAGPLRAYLEARTAYVDRAVVHALDQGMPQVVLLGAGYDGRAWRYDKPGARWFEVDHPDTQRDKQCRLRRLGIAADRVVVVPADFTVDRLGPTLTAAGHRSDLPSLFVCEGVAVYLRLTDFERLLAEARSVAAAGSRLVLTVSAAMASDAVARRRATFERSVAAVGEPARSSLTAREAEPVLRRLGWRTLPTPGLAEDAIDRARLAGFVLAEPVWAFLYVPRASRHSLAGSPA